MLGIGLGAFVDGFKGGYGLRQDIDRNNREKKDRDTVVGINTAATKAFDAEVSAGTMKPEQYDEFFQQYALPKLVAERRAAGDIEGANALKEWGETEDAKRGARLSMSAMIKAQTGDAAGALEDAIKAARINGYLSHGMEIVGQKPVTDVEHGPGFLVTMKGPDGKQVEQFIAEGEVGGVVSTFVNPQAAWESQVAARGAASKRTAELEDYRTRKGIDAEFDTGTGAKRRSDAIEALRKRLDGGLSGNDPSFDDLPPEEQEKLITQEITLVTGKPSTPGTAVAPAPAPKVLVDQNTGQIVTPEQAIPAPKADAKEDRYRAAPGLGQPAPKPAAAQPQPERLPPSSPGSLLPTAEAERAQLEQSAATLIQQGADPNEIARRLTEAGVPQTRWPTEMVMGIGK